MSEGITFAFDPERVLEKGIDRVIAQYPKVVQRALSRTADSTRTFMAREISGAMGLKVGTVKANLKIDLGSLVARVRASGKRIPLIQMGARGPEPSRGKGRGVTIAGGAAASGFMSSGSRRVRLEHAFIATMPNSKHRGVFLRSRFTPGGLRYSKKPHTDKKTGRLHHGRREVIVEQYGPSIADFFIRARPDGQRFAGMTLARNVAHELTFAFGQIQER